jgi:hypothetical protein
MGAISLSGHGGEAKVEPLYCLFLVSSDDIDYERYEELTRHTIQASNGSAGVKPSGSAHAVTDGRMTPVTLLN